jgi:hypothetical protein
MTVLRAPQRVVIQIEHRPARTASEASPLVVTIETADPPTMRDELLALVNRICPDEAPF